MSLRLFGLELKEFMSRAGLSFEDHLTTPVVIEEIEKLGDPDFFTRDKYAALKAYGDIVNRLIVNFFKNVLYKKQDLPEWVIWTRSLLDSGEIDTDIFDDCALLIVSEYLIPVTNKDQLKNPRFLRKSDFDYASKKEDNGRPPISRKDEPPIIDRDELPSYRTNYISTIDRVNTGTDINRRNINYTITKSDFDYANKKEDDGGGPPISRKDTSSLEDIISFRNTHIGRALSKVIGSTDFSIINRIDSSSLSGSYKIGKDKSVGPYAIINRALSHLIFDKGRRATAWKRGGRDDTTEISALGGRDGQTFDIQDRDDDYDSLHHQGANLRKLEDLITNAEAYGINIGQLNPLIVTYMTMSIIKNGTDTRRTEKSFKEIYKKITNRDTSAIADIITKIEELDLDNEYLKLDNKDLAEKIAALVKIKLSDESPNPYPTQEQIAMALGLGEETGTVGTAFADTELKFKYLTTYDSTSRRNRALNLTDLGGFLRDAREINNLPLSWMRFLEKLEKCYSVFENNILKSRKISVQRQKTRNSPDYKYPPEVKRPQNFENLSDEKRDKYEKAVEKRDKKIKEIEEKTRNLGVTENDLAMTIDELMLCLDWRGTREDLIETWTEIKDIVAKYRMGRKKK